MTAEAYYPVTEGILDRVDSIMWVAVGVFWWSWMT